MQRSLHVCGVLSTSLAILAGFVLHELSLEAGRAADPKPAGVKAKGAAQPQKNGGRNKSNSDTTALRTQRALAQRAAIADEDIYGVGANYAAYSSSGGKNGNSSANSPGSSGLGSSAMGGSTFGSGAGPFFGAALGGFQGIGNSLGNGLSVGTGTSATRTGTQTSGTGTASTGGQGQTGTGSTAIPVLNQKVLDFADSNLGKQVGSGICWELGADALAYANAEPPHGQVFGDAVPLASMLPGDMLEFDNAHFVGANYWLSLGAPYHTAIVSEFDGSSIAMLNQNVNNVKLVQITIIHLADLRSGTMAVYRPATRRN